MILSRKLGRTVAQIGFGIAVASTGYADTALATASWQRGYIDSPFVVADGSAIYFLHSVASTFDQLMANPYAVPVANYLPNHHGQNGAFWWNTDLYVSYRTSNGTWSFPENLGDNVNTEDGECCPWVNAEQTVLLFIRESAKGDPALSGSFMATRPTASDPWGVPVALPGELGDFAATRFENFHLVPSGNLYFEGPLLGNQTLFAALSTGVGSWGPATVIAELQEAGVDLTQSWASDDELTLFYNRRTADGNTLLLTSVHADPTAAWNAPKIITTTQFQDAAGQLVWGEPSFASDQAMFFVRFNTSVPEWTAELLRASVNVDGSYGPPEMLIFDPPPINTVPAASGWDLIVMTLLVLTAGTLICTRHRIQRLLMPIGFGLLIGPLTARAQDAGHSATSLPGGPVPQGQVCFTPNIGSVDMLVLFALPEQWASARPMIDVFKFYQTQVRGGGWNFTDAIGFATLAPAVALGTEYDLSSDEDVDYADGHGTETDARVFAHGLSSASSSWPVPNPSAHAAPMRRGSVSRKRPTPGVGTSSERYTRTSGTAWRNTGLRVGAVYSIAIDPLNTNIVYIGTYAYLWKTTDAGATWVVYPWENTVTSPYTDPISIAISSQNNSILYVGSIGPHAYKSYDAGVTWIEISTGLPIDTGTAWSIVVDPSDSSIAYLCVGANEVSGQGGVYKTTDGGGTWTAANVGLAMTSAWSLTMDPANASVLYAGSWGVHKSLDGGQTWTVVLPDLVAKALVVSSSGDVYAGMFFGGGIHKSTDGGTTWTTVNVGLPVSPTVWSLVEDPANPGTLYAGTENHGVYKSTSAGASWFPVSVGMEAADSKRVWSLAVDPADSSFVYAGTIGGGLFKSSDGGALWSKTQSDTIVTSFAVNPLDPSDIVAGLAGTGVARSSDGGQSWEHLFGDLYIDDVFAVAMDPIDPMTLYVGGSVGGGVSKSTDGGFIWARVNQGLTISPWANVWSVVVTPNDSMTVYAAADDNSGVFKTTDAALTWHAINNGVTDRNMAMVALDPVDSNVVYAGTWTGTLYKSGDSGANWSTMGDVFPGSVRSIAPDPTDPSVLYVGTMGAGVYKSVDGGVTWLPKNNGLTNLLVSTVVLDPADPSIVYASTGLFDPGNTIPGNGNGVYVSLNGGETWAEMNQGLDNLRVWYLGVVPGSPGTLLAGTDGDGVFTSALVVTSSIPTVSVWGMTAMTLLLLIVGTLILHRQRLWPHPLGVYHAKCLR